MDTEIQQAWGGTQESASSTGILQEPDTSGLQITLGEKRVSVQGAACSPSGVVRGKISGVRKDQGIWGRGKMQTKLESAFWTFS